MNPDADDRCVLCSPGRPPRQQLALCADCPRVHGPRLLSTLSTLLGYLIPQTSIGLSRAIVTAAPTMLARLELLAELTAGHRYAGPRPRMATLDRELTALGLPSVGERVATSHPSRSGPTCEHPERRVAGIVHDARYCEYCWRRVPQTRRPCVRCGRLDHVNCDRLCKPCRAADAIERLFGPELERRRPDLLPLRAHLQAAQPRYLLKARVVLNKLERAINLQAPLTHDSIDALGTPAATAHVRSLLVAVGVLPVRDEHAANLQQWADVQLRALPHRADQLAVAVFIRWNQARRRRGPHTTVTQAANDKRELRIILAFITFLNQGSQTIATATQADLHSWMTTAASDAFRIRGFVSWCVRSRTNRHLIPPTKERLTFRIGGTIGAANETALDRALTDPSLDPRLKLAIVLITVYGIRTHRIANLRLRDLSAEGSPRVRLGSDWLELPPAVTPWIRTIQSTTRRVRGAGERRNVWLFPGYRHGSPVSPSSLAATLRQLGLSPSRAHQASTANIISQVPPVVAARLLGVALSTAADWHGLIANTRSSMR